MLKVIIRMPFSEDVQLGEKNNDKIIRGSNVIWITVQVQIGRFGRVSDEMDQKDKKEWPILISSGPGVPNDKR